MISDLLQNVRSGTAVCLFRKRGPDDFRISLDQLVLLVILDLFVALGEDWIRSLPRPEFNPSSVSGYGFNIAAFLLAAYLVGRLLQTHGAIRTFCIYVFSMSPFLYLLWFGLDSGRAKLFGDDDGLYWLFYISYAAWMLTAMGWCAWQVAGHLSSRVVAAFFIVAIVWYTPLWVFDSGEPFWYAATESGSDDDFYKDYRDLNAERVFYDQPELLDNSLGKLQMQRPGTTDLYFVGFGSYAYQDVFMKEIRYAKDLFDARFDTRHRSVALINNLATYEKQPLASYSNLKITLRRIGDLIDPDEDIVMLFLTTHGSQKHELSVDFWPLPLNDITPSMLKSALDDANIKWRVIIVSACYSGGFTGQLIDPYTLVATAAASDRTSFGCDSENDFTYFGEALFKDQLQTQSAFIQAFVETTKAIKSREREENLAASRPELHVGHFIEAKLQSLEQEILHRACAGDDEAVRMESGPGAHSVPVCSD